MKVLFWGTPEFGLPSLAALQEAGHELVGVVTNPDRPAGRGRTVRPSPVKEWATTAGVPILQPERPCGEAFMDAARALGPDISIVAAYGQILRQEVIDLPALGSLNVHASLLPELRGAAPINWAIIRGHAQGGVTIMRMVLELDAGAILAQVPIPIGETTTAGELYEATAAAGGRAAVRVLADLEVDGAREIAQDDDRATYAPKLNREAVRIDWSLSATELDRWIRGCDPWPGSWTEMEGRTVQCFVPAIEPHETRGAAPGVVLEAHGSHGLLIATGAGSLRIGEVKPSGRRRMTAGEWVRGIRGMEGARFD